MPVVDEGPALQGDLSSPVWQQAMQLQDFVAANHIATLPVPTEVFTICDSEFLYAGFVCHEPQIGQLRTFTSGHDGPVWTDDCVEVTLDVANGKVWLYHWIVNSHGLIWDGLHFPTGLDASFNAAAVAKCSVQSDRWICELKIPFQAVGGPPRPGEVWGINFCRERRVSDDVELTSWFPAQTGFSDPANTGEAVFAPPGDGVVLSVLSRGGACADVNEDGLNVFSVRADNTGAEYAKVRAEMRTDGHVVAAAEAVIAGGKAGTVAVGYQVPYPGQAVFQYLVHVDGKQVYESQLQACKPKFRGPRSWVVPDPMFEGLFSEEPAGLCREGVLIWGHLNDVSLLRETAKRFGVRYVEDEIYREHGVHGLHLIGHAIRQKDPEDPWTRWNVTNVPVAERQPADVPWILDPRSIEHHIEEYEKMLQMPHPLVWGFFAGDEMEDRAMAQGAGLMAKPGDYEYIKQADEEVKREFGGGKWGIPSGIIEQDPNPYKWIAYQRWINARMRDRHRRLRDLVRKYEPDMPIVSTDAGGIISPYEWSTQAEYFDIFTHQIGCRGSQWRAQPGCISKIVSDLTGKEFWPCVHVENYGMDTTPEEVVEELSQVFRNGGSGFHFFLSEKLPLDHVVQLFGCVCNVIRRERLCLVADDSPFHRAGCGDGFPAFWDCGNLG